MVSGSYVHYEGITAYEPFTFERKRNSRYVPYFIYSHRLNDCDTGGSRHLNTHIRRPESRVRNNVTPRFLNERTNSLCCDKFWNFYDGWMQKELFSED
jgi:hypothetical protein